MNTSTLYTCILEPMNAHKKYLLFLSMFFMNQQPARAQDPQKHEDWVTIFVHGIMSIKPYLSSENMIRFLYDDVENTVYSSAVDIMRNDPFFYQNQAMQGYGMHPIDMTYPNKFNIPAVKANLLERIQKLSPHSAAVRNHFYTFGWTGLMSNTARYNEAIRFFEAIEQVLKFNFHAKSIYPKIRIIGFSHGGNVALNLAAVRQRLYPESTLKVDQLILLGTPIQPTTDTLVADPIFEKIYNIYSHADRVQNLDIFGAPRRFSHKRFKPRKEFQLPCNLTQIELRMTRAKSGIALASKQFEKTLDLNNRKIISGKHPLLRDASPGHAELWFFGWTPHHYRTNFPLHPFPAVTLLPLIIDHIPSLQKELRCPIVPAHTLVADIRPQHGVILLKYKDKNESQHITIPFLSGAQFKELQEEVLKHRPETYTEKAYTEHTDFAYHTALKQKKNELKARRTQERALAKKKRHKKESGDTTIVSTDSKVK